MPHPDLIIVQREVALADPKEKLRTLERWALHFGHLCKDGEIQKADAVDGLIEIAQCNGLCATKRRLEDVEHVIGQGLQGIRTIGPVSSSAINGDDHRLANNPRWQDAAISAADLRRMTFDPVRYVVPGVIPEGVAMLVGRPKIGKSWLGLDLAVACSSDRFTLGTIKPNQGDVLYLALEDGKRRIQRRIGKLLPSFKEEWPTRLTLVPMGGWRRTDQGGLDDIEAWCKSVPNPTLVIVDTLERIRKPVHGAKQLYSSDYEAISELQKVASDYGIAIVVLHHDRKAEGDDPFDTVSGTLGLTGAADTVLIIKRRQNGVVLYARGRDIEESETALQFDKNTCRWTILGAASEVHRSTERARVIGVLSAAAEPLSVKEIIIETEMLNRNAVDILLSKMVKGGEIVRVQRGRYTLPDREPGKIGQKERLACQPVGLKEKTGNLSNLSDLSGDRSNTAGNGSLRPSLAPFGSTPASQAPKAALASDPWEGLDIPPSLRRERLGPPVGGSKGDDLGAFK
jgi:hypothetical protein